MFQMSVSVNSQLLLTVTIWIGAEFSPDWIEEISILEYSQELVVSGDLVEVRSLLVGEE